MRRVISVLGRVVGATIDWVRGPEYVCLGDSLVKRRAGRAVIPMHDIAGWRVIPEMVFDIVIIEMCSGESYRLLDSDNSLLRLLSERLPERQVK